MELDPVQLSTHCFVRCSQGAESPTGFNQEDRLSAGRVEHSGGWIVGDRPTGQIPRYRARREEGAALLALGGGLVLPHAGSLDSPTDRTRPTRRSRPRLVGTLTVYHAGETLLEADLRGRKARLGKGPLRLQGASLEGSLKPVRRRDEIDHVTEPGVKVAAKANGAGRRGVIWSGESLHVGDFEILYTA